MTKTLKVEIKSKEFIISGKTIKVLGKINFEIEKGEFVSIIGPSGCGKTTILRLILGLENDYIGTIKLEGKIINGPGLDRGIVFQEPRLIPWLSVQKNIEFALRGKSNGMEASNQISHLIELVGLKGFEKAWPNQLSGGMAQRVALARALVNVPEVILLDEPFGALDSHTRMFMQEELLRILNKEKITTLMVTHDIDEAVFLSDRIIILTHRPAYQKDILRIDLKKPRKRASVEFVELHTKILKEFYSINGDKKSHLENSISRKVL